MIYYPFNFETNTYKKDCGTLVTAFLHDLPYFDEEIETLRNPCEGSNPWGGDLETVETYIKGVAF